MKNPMHARPSVFVDLISVDAVTGDRLQHQRLRWSL